MIPGGIPDAIPGDISDAIPGEILGSIPGDIPDAIPGEILGSRSLMQSLVRSLVKPLPTVRAIIYPYPAFMDFKDCNSF